MNNEQAEGIRGAVTAALSTLTNAQLHELTMEPYMELRQAQTVLAA